MAVIKSILSPTFLTYILGCRVNQAETAVISEQLTVNSWKMFNEKIHSSPSIVLVNTCAVTQKAERESRKAIHHFKRIYPKARIIALGCAAKFVKDADLVIENFNKEKTINLIKEKFPELLPDKLKKNCSLSTAHCLLSSSGRALVKIQEGCDQFCNYCIVPYLRGKPKSTSSDEIVCQINKLVDEKIKEIILCGINLSLYGQDFRKKFALTDLIKRILKETSAERISLSSIEPEYLYKNHKFIELFMTETRLSKYFHLALQSGSSETLRTMGRKTNIKKLLEILQNIKKAVPEFTFRADIIVGFPTETEENFKETLDFINNAPITFTHVFPFSLRQGTLAEKMVKEKKWQDISPSIKKERIKKVMELTQKIQKKEVENLMGKTSSCLIIRKLSKAYEGLNSNSWPVIVTIKKKGQKSGVIKGKILPVVITSYKDNKLNGRLIEQNSPINNETLQKDPFLF